MIAAITGQLVLVREDHVRLQLGGIQYQVLVPDLVRRTLQVKLGEEITLHTLQYIDGNPQKGRLTPRLVGFLTEVELEFFELFCTAEGIGVKLALRALSRPVRDIADIIQRQDAQQLATLPGIGGTSAEKIIAKLRKKVVKFALMRPTDGPAPQEVASDVYDEANSALLAVGYSDAEARRLLDQTLERTKRKFTAVDDLLQEVWKRQ